MYSSNLDIKTSERKRLKIYQCEVHKIIIFNQEGKQCCFQQLHIIESIHSSEVEQSESDSKLYHLLAMGICISYSTSLSLSLTCKIGVY